MYRVFVCYSRKDSRWVRTPPGAQEQALVPYLREKLRRHSARIDVWCDEELERKTGTAYDRVIEEAIDSSQTAVLILSDDFFLSDYIAERELPRIRARVDRGEMQLFPIVVGHPDWGQNDDAVWLKGRQIHPSAIRPLIEIVAHQHEWSRIRTDLSVALREQVLAFKPSGASGDGVPVAAPPAPSPADSTEELLRLREELARLRAAQANPAATVAPAPPPTPSISRPASKPGERAELALPGGVTMGFCWCPPGTFMMGSPKSEVERSGYEGPVEVTLTRGFWMAETEVSQAQWRAVMRTDPSHFKGDNLPVEKVSWDDAMEFCRKLEESSRRSVSLPTEAQWEYACRAGTPTPFHFGARITPDQVNYDGNYPYGGATKGLYRQKTTPVGSFPANVWGLHDMHGNVWEWCADWYGRMLHGGTDPAGPSSGRDRVIRGGGWGDRAQDCRSARRGGFVPSYRYDDIGFRVLLPVQ